MKPARTRYTAGCLALGAAAAVGLVSACFPSLDGLESGPEANEGGTDASDATAESADVLVRRTDDAGCALPSQVTAAPDDSPALEVCNLDAMMDFDGVTGGLDRNEAGTVPTYSSQPVTSCARFDFAGPVVGAQKIEIRGIGAASACGKSACVPNQPDAGCNTSDVVFPFAGPTRELREAKFLGEIVFGPPGPLLTRAAAVPAGVDVAFVFVCRSNAGTARDDIAIDGVRVCPTK